jgi:TM2 domain-containing membrane protein YozV
MKIDSFSQKVSELVAKDDLEGAISLLSQLLKNSSKLDEVILHSGRLSELKKQIRLGVVDFQNSNIERNRIRAAIMGFMGDIDESISENPDVKREIDFIPENRIVIQNGPVHSGKGNINQNYGGIIQDGSHNTNIKYETGLGEAVRETTNAIGSGSKVIGSGIVQSSQWTADQLGISTNKKKIITAVILAVLLGFIGVHRFYLGQKVWGITYFVISVLSILGDAPVYILIGVIALLEGLLLLSMDREKFDKKYNYTPQRTIE